MNTHVVSQTAVNELQKNINKKVTRMEHEYQDLIIKTEFLKASKVKIKKDIEFYKSIIDKVAFMYDIQMD